MPPTAAISHYAILTAMLAPAFFLTATAALLTSANARLARIIDRARSLLQEIANTEDADKRQILESRVTIQRRRSQMVLRASLLLYIAISAFVGTSLTVAGDSFFNHIFGPLPTLLAVLGVLAMLAASVLLAREAHLAVRAVNDEMDDAQRFAVGKP